MCLVDAICLFDELALSSMGKIMALKMDFHAIVCQIVARLNLMLQCFFTLKFFEELTFSLHILEIKEDDEEFDQLVKFLDLISMEAARSHQSGVDHPTDETEVPMEDESTQMSFQDSSSPMTAMSQQHKQHIHIINVVEWFSQDGDELKMWCSEFDNMACRDHMHLARKAMRVNVLWKQPQLLNLHQNFNQIFQVRLIKSLDGLNNSMLDLKFLGN